MLLKMHTLPDKQEVTNQYFYREAGNKMLKASQSTSNMSSSKLGFVKSPYTIDQLNNTRHKSFKPEINSKIMTSMSNTQSNESTRIWSDSSRSGMNSRNNYSSVLSTIKDLKNFLGQNLEDIQT